MAPATPAGAGAGAPPRPKVAELLAARERVMGDSRPFAASDESRAGVDGSGQEPEPTCRVTIAMIDGRCWSEEARPERAATDLKEKVAARLGVTSARVKLLFGHAQLQSRATLEQSGVGEGALLTAILVPPVYQGSQVYKAIMSGAVGSSALGTEADERIMMVEDVMDKKAILNDAFEELVRRRARSAPSPR